MTTSLTERFTICDTAELARLARTGDFAALDGLTRCYGARLFAIGRRHCRDQQEAEDAVQDALVSAAQNLETWRGDGALEAWVGRMVANACHKITRGQKNQWHTHSTDIELATDVSPEVSIQQAELAEMLGEALLELPPVDRVIVLLAETEDWTGPQIAEHLELSPAAVRKRLSRARQQLRERVDRDSH